MNLNYSILWYDDQPDSFYSIDLEPITEEIASWGFVPRIQPVFKAEDFTKQAPFKNYDLIVVDFLLEGSTYGDEFIANVRNQDVFTEIIFYSANPASDLWQAIHQRELEGVFVTNKNSITQKIIRVARQSVRKVLDLENMRGIVMSEVGDLDALLANIFNRAMQEITPTQQQSVFDRFHENTSAQNKEFQTALSAFKNEPSIEGLLNLCDSDKRWQNFNRVKKHHALLKAHTFTRDYIKEILWPRNCLAHGIPVRKPDGNLLFRFGGKDYHFDDNVSRDLRKNILEYKSAFSEIADMLKCAK